MGPRQRPDHLGTIGGVPGTSLARAVDADGGVIVGYSITPSGADHAFRWQSGAMTDLGTIGVSGNSTALAVDGDGVVVVGSSAVGAATHAFLWTQAASMQDLNTVLAVGGVNMTGVTLTRASGLSSDGSLVGGSGTFPSTGGNTQAFLARVVPAAPPSSGLPPVVGVTTPSSVLNSINALAASQQAQIISRNTLASLLTGRNQQVNCSSCINVAPDLAAQRASRGIRVDVGARMRGMWR